MIFEQLFDTKSSTYTYIISSGKGREALIIDPVIEHTEEYRLYDGYGACPLTVAYGKVMLAEFCYGGKVTPSFPFDPTKPSSMYWQMKSRLFPWLQWNVMFKGKEWSKPNHKAIEN